MRFLIRYSLFALLPLVSSLGYSWTDRLSCGNVNGPAAVTTICRSQAEVFPVQVSYRRMPNWSRHANMLYVSICEMEVSTQTPSDEIIAVDSEGNAAPLHPDATERTEEAETFENENEEEPFDTPDEPEPQPTEVGDSNPALPPVKEWTEKQCKYRLCTEAEESKMFSINGLPLFTPGLVQLRFWFGRNHREFRVKCSSIE